MKSIAQFILFKILDWKIVGNFPKQLNKYIIIAAPHTHWLDFPLALTVKWAAGIPANYIGKASLFKPPFGFIFRWLGGAPVERTKNSNNVDSIVSIFKSREKFILGMSPEGTRKKVTQWRTGFYYIAKGAQIPIIMATLNFKAKEIKVSEPYYTTDNIEHDFKVFHSFFDGVVGKIPEYS